MSESPPFPLTELIAASPSETFLRFISSNASVVTRSVCKSFNERASSFCSEKKTRVTEEVVHACSFSLVRWLLTLPRPPEPEQLLFALAQMKGGEEILALLAGTSPTRPCVCAQLRPEAQLSWQSLSHFSNFSAVLRGAVWGNNRDLFARFLPRLAEVVGADGILTAVLGCGMLGWLPKGIAADRRWILSLFSQHFQANLRAGIFLRARDLETLVGFPLSALEDLASNGLRIVTEFGPLQSVQYRDTYNVEAARLHVWALKGEVDKIVASDFPRGVNGAWENSLTDAALFVQHLLVSAAVANLSVEEMERLSEWAVVQLGIRLRETDQSKSKFHAIVFAVSEYARFSMYSNHDPVHAVIPYGPPERAIRLLEWMRSLDPPVPLSETFCTGAGSYGQLEVLKWLREREDPCPWNESVMLECDNSDVVAYVRQSLGMLETVEDKEKAFKKSTGCSWTRPSDQQLDNWKQIRAENPSIRWGSLNPQTPAELQMYEIDVAKHFDSELRWDSDPPPPPEGLEAVLATHIESCLDSPDMKLNLDITNRRPFLFATSLIQNRNFRHFQWLLRMGTEGVKEKLKKRLREEYIPKMQFVLRSIVRNVHHYYLFPEDPDPCGFGMSTPNEYAMQWTCHFALGKLDAPLTLSSQRIQFDKNERDALDFLKVVEWMTAEDIQFRGRGLDTNFSFPAMRAHTQFIRAATRLVEQWGREEWRVFVDRCR